MSKKSIIVSTIVILIIGLLSYFLPRNFKKNILIKDAVTQQPVVGAEVILSSCITIIDGTNCTEVDRLVTDSNGFFPTTYIRKGRVLVRKEDYLIFDEDFDSRANIPEIISVQPLSNIDSVAKTETEKSFMLREYWKWMAEKETSLEKCQTFPAGTFTNLCVINVARVQKDYKICVTSIPIEEKDNCIGGVAAAHENIDVCLTAPAPFTCAKSYKLYQNECWKASELPKFNGNILGVHSVCAE